MRLVKNILSNTSGTAVVEATILFPVIIMIFAALVLLAMYLPQRAILQRVTQITANALGAARSDDFVEFKVTDEEAGNYIGSEPKNVYAMLFNAFFTNDETAEAEKSVRLLEDKMSLIKSTGRHDNSSLFKDENLNITYVAVNYIVYKEIIISAQREIPMPYNLSFIGFPKTLKLTSTSTCVIQNGDEFLRTIDMASDFVKWVSEKYDLDDKLKGITDAIDKVTKLLGLNK